MINTLAANILILYSVSNARIALGVQGMIVFFPKINLPRFTGFNPSASFFGSIASSTSSVLTKLGSGSWTINPVHSGF